MEGDLHVVPIGDLREHIESKNCWCAPSETEDGVFVHHAMDCRELYEAGTLRLN